MSSRRLRWIVLGFACLWFGMLVPVHQRGEVKLPGAERVRDGAPAGHCSRASDPNSACHKRQQQQQGAGKQDAPAAGGDCAVCHFIAGLHAPPPPVMVAARLGLLELLPIETAAVRPPRHPALPFHGLDPPLA